jgi:hypothetical protein
MESPVTTTDHHSPDVDPTLVAADARSILACPSTVSLVIEGEEHAVDEDDELGLSDHRGTPTFVCLPSSPVARAAADNRSALLTVTSGLGPRGGRERGDTLTLAGRLERTGAQHCDCCNEIRHVVSLDLNFVLLAHRERQLRVPLEEFRSRAHHLNRGHLQRSVEHANDCHQEELRQAVGTGTGTRAGDLGGVRIARLTPSDVVIQWVDGSGAHEQVVTFARAARDLSELGDMLRRGLHAGLC